MNGFGEPKVLLSFHYLIDLIKLPHIFVIFLKQGINLYILCLKGFAKLNLNIRRRFVGIHLTVVKLVDKMQNGRGSIEKIIR